jgi:hypothetical protein
MSSVTRDRMQPVEIAEARATGEQNKRDEAAAAACV